MPERLQKILSHAGIASRRLAEDLIRQGRVSVNGRVVTELGTKAEPAQDDVRVDGRRLKRPPPRRYLLLNKPRAVVSTRSDPQQRTTVIDLLARLGIEGYFYPVGRLDYDSEGVLLLTNDGDFAERVMHPRYELERTYEARVKGVPDEHDLTRLARGLVVDGRRTRPARVRLLRTQPSASGPQSVVELTLREGRNRQVREMCDAIGHPVVRLCRTRLGGLTARGLASGAVRDLTPAEVRELLRAPAREAAAPASRRQASKSATLTQRRRS